MKANITLMGPVPYGRAGYELQALIQTADGNTNTLHWSTHFKREDAVEYMNRFNTEDSSHEKK